MQLGGWMDDWMRGGVKRVTADGDGWMRGGVKRVAADGDGGRRRALLHVSFIETFE